LDAGIVGLVDERSDRVGRLVEQLGNRGGDDQTDGDLEFPGGVSELGEELVGQAKAAHPGQAAPVAPGAAACAGDGLGRMSRLWLTGPWAAGRRSGRWVV
jgi:8-oxo-dGTP pyrophosphatase MutT (NUDIX family)